MITVEQLHQLLAFGVKNGASDFHLKVDEPPAFRLSSGLHSRWRNNGHSSTDCV